MLKKGSIMKVFGPRNRDEMVQIVGGVETNICRNLNQVQIAKTHNSRV